MHFDLNEEQADIRAMVRQFTEQEITPHAGVWMNRTIFLVKSIQKWQH